MPLILDVSSWRIIFFVFRSWIYTARIFFDTINSPSHETIRVSNTKYITSSYPLSSRILDESRFPSLNREFALTFCIR